MKSLINLALVISTTALFGAIACELNAFYIGVTSFCLAGLLFVCASFFDD